MRRVGRTLAGIAAAKNIYGGSAHGTAPGAKIVSVCACLFIEGCTAHALIEGHRGVLPEDARLTVITCGGTFDPRTRTFSDRLIVVGKLRGGERLGAS